MSLGLLVFELRRIADALDAEREETRWLCLSYRMFARDKRVWRRFGKMLRESESTRPISDEAISWWRSKAEEAPAP